MSEEIKSTEVKDETVETKETDTTKTTDEVNPAIEAVGKLLDKKEEIAEDAKEDLAEKPESEREAEEKSTPEGEEPEKKDESETTPNADEEVKKLNLPSRLLHAAKRNHVTSQEVLDLGDKAEMVLTRLADNSDRVSEQLGALGRKSKEQAALNPKKEVAETTLDVKINEDDTDEVRELKTALKATNDKIAALSKQFSEKAVQSTNVSLLERDKKIDTYFDGKTDEFPEFGNSKDLSESGLAIRRKIWQFADDIIAGAELSGQSISLADALDLSLSQYESKTPKKKVSREKLLDEVKEREKKLIHRASSKKGNPAKQDLKNGAIKAVRDILNKGQAGW